MPYDMFHFIFAIKPIPCHIAKGTHTRNMHHVVDDVLLVVLQRGIAKLIETYSA
jgi:hypothetical protein